MSSHLNWFLSGFILQQTYTYYRRSKVQKDPLWIRLVVFGTIAIQFIDTADIAYSAFVDTVQVWGSSTGLSNPSLGFAITSNLTVLTLTAASSLTQGFYVWRIWTFSGAVGSGRLKTVSRVTSAFIVLLSVCATACYLVVFAESLILVQVTEWYSILEYTANAAVAMGDALITVLMTILLYRARTQTVFKRTRGTISRINRITLQSGLLTTFLAICALVLNLTNQEIYEMFWELSTKSYAISLFANLNARSQVHGNVQYISTEHDLGNADTDGVVAYAPPESIAGTPQLDEVVQNQNER